MKKKMEQQNEIAPGLTVEEIKAIYFNADALKEPPYRIFRLNTQGFRYYYRFEGEQPVFYPSVTAMLKQVMPTPPSLIEWMIQNGKDGATEKRDLAAAYGTFMHMQFETLLINRRYDFDAVPGLLAAYLVQENIPERVFHEWIVKIRKDVAAFAQFVKDYNVRPLAVEIGLVHPDYGYAGCIDLPCVMSEPKTGEMFTAIIDFKSGRKGFYEEHELQLHLYRDMWNVNFPDVPVARIFNFAPKDWRTKPTYTLKEQTNAKSAAKLPHLLALATVEEKENTVQIVHGQFDLDSGDIMDNVLQLTLSELVKAKAEPEKPKKGRKKADGGTQDAKSRKVSTRTRKPRKSEISQELPLSDFKEIEQ